jgi:hypothetical protein
VAFKATSKYGFQQRSNGRGAVVRIGPKGGWRVVAVYRSQDTAKRVSMFLDELAGEEV